MKTHIEKRPVLRLAYDDGHGHRVLMDEHGVVVLELHSKRRSSVQYLPLFEVEFMVRAAHRAQSRYRQDHTRARPQSRRQHYH